MTEQQQEQGRITVILKLRPTKAQARTFERWLWHLTGVWNWSVRYLDAERTAGRRVTRFDLKYRLTGHSRRMGMPARALSGTAETAWRADQRHRQGLSGRARLKGRRRPLTSIAFDNWNSPPANGRVLIPGFERVRFHRQDIPSGHIGSGRIVKRASGWYLCLFVKASPRPITPVGDGEVGIDPGFASLLTLSTSERISPPTEWAITEARLGQAQRGRRRRLTARLHERIGNRRRNRNHLLSRRLVAENQVIAFSKDNISGIARRFGKSVSSAGHYQLRSMLAYKSRAGGRQYIEVSSRNSTRTCSACGALTGPTGWAGLKVREWDCGACGAHHDRDVNAAVNTLIAGRGTRHEGSREAASGIAS